MQPACIEVKLHSGDTLSAFVEDVPWLDYAAVQARFRREASLFVTDDDADQLVEMAHDLWNAATLARFSRV